MAAPDPFRAASDFERDYENKVRAATLSADRLLAQMRAAAREMLNGDHASSSIRRRDAERRYKSDMAGVAIAACAAVWEKALADEKAARSGKGA